MKHKVYSILLASAFLLSTAQAEALKEESLESYKERMQWFADSQYGMFIHFGLYSVLGGEWQGEQADWYSEWIQATMDIPSEEYAELIHQFNPEDFNAYKIVMNAKRAGMTYLVITAKHHEGFCLWDSDYTEFDVGNSPFKGRDILMELKNACEEHGLKFGLYYSIIDWNHPSQKPQEEGRTFIKWGQTRMVDGMKADYINYQTNQVLELIERYEPALLWFDGDWVDWWTLEDGIKLYNEIRRADANIIVNNRVAKRGQFELDYVTQEQRHFDETFAKHWEGCYTLNESWGYKKHDHAWKTPEVIYEKLKDVNSKGGVLLLNVGPDGRGVVQNEAWEILKQTAELLEKNPIQKRAPHLRQMPGIIKAE